MFFKSLWPALLWALFILFICGIPGSRLPRVDFLKWFRPDKLVHLFVFGVLCYLLIRGFLKQDLFSFLKTHPKQSAFCIVILYAILIEVLQEYIFIERSGDARDVVADAFGALLGIWFYNLLRKKRFRGDSSAG